MSPEFKSIKIPAWAYENAVRARNELVYRGLDSIPTGLREPDLCPHCNSPVQHVTVEYEHISCGTCGYKQQTLNVGGNTAAGVGIGFILGLGLAALFGALASAAPPPLPKPARRRVSPRRKRTR